MHIETLLDEREIYRQLVRFARAMDNRDWQTIRAITSPDLIADFGTGDITGNDEVIAFIRSFLQHCGITQHMLGNVIIDIAGDTATSQAYVADLHLSAHDHSDQYFRTLGAYADTWSKVDGAWIMTQRRKDNRATLGAIDIFKK